MGREHQWPWSTVSSRRLIAIICTARCNGASSHARKTRLDEEATTGRDAASHGRAMRWGAMGQERQWQWSTDGSLCQIAYIGTHDPMAHRRGRANPCFNQSFLTPVLRMCHLFKTTYATLGSCLSIDSIWWGNFLRRGKPLKGGRTLGVWQV